MTKVTITSGAIILRRLKVQRHDLVALSRVLQGPLVRRFDHDALALTMNARWSFGRFGIHLNTSISVNPFDLKIRYAYDVSQVGHRCSPLNYFSQIQFNECRCPPLMR